MKSNSLQSHTKNSVYAPLKETYAGGSAFSIYGALKGNLRSCPHKNECWCSKASNPQITLPSDGVWYPSSMCAQCHGNQKG